jgi:AraC-like DNA-binding protein
MTDGKIQYKKTLPDKSIADFVECFWMVKNPSEVDKEVLVLPDANFDLVMSKGKGEQFQIWLIGLNTVVNKGIIEAYTKTFFINFKLFAAEYLFHKHIAKLVNEIQILPNNFWGLDEADLNDFDEFCLKVTQTIKQLLPKQIDNRKLKLSELIYTSKGSMTVNELSENVFWSSRQINRYFTEYFGITLKAYCNILRFRASFEQIKEGKLFPEQDYSDQAHFSREVKKLSGVNLRELHRNKNDRFIQVSLSDRK